MERERPSQGSEDVIVSHNFNEKTQFSSPDFWKIFKFFLPKSFVKMTGQTYELFNLVAWVDLKKGLSFLAWVLYKWHKNPSVVHEDRAHKHLKILASSGNFLELASKSNNKNKKKGLKLSFTILLTNSLLEGISK